MVDREPLQVAQSPKHSSHIRVVRSKYLFEAHEASHAQLSIFPTVGLVHKVKHFLEGVYAKELISQVGLHELDDNKKKLGVPHVTQFVASGPEQVKQVASHCLHLRSESSGY